MVMLEDGKRSRQVRPEGVYWAKATRTTGGSASGDGRVPCSYCNTGLWGGDTRRKRAGIGWLGMIRVWNTQDPEFLLFSYLNGDRAEPVPFDMFASTSDLNLLCWFADDIRRLSTARLRNKLRINVYKGSDIHIDAEETEPILLPESVHSDIVNQATTFFRQADLYRQLAAPYRRGFLFAGPPGNGKSMMIHSLVRRCWKAFRAEAHFMNIRPDTDCDDLAMFLNWERRRAHESSSWKRSILSPAKPR